MSTSEFTPTFFPVTPDIAEAASEIYQKQHAVEGAIDYWIDSKTAASLRVDPKDLVVWEFDANPTIYDDVSLTDWLQRLNQLNPEHLRWSNSRLKKLCKGVANLFMEELAKPDPAITKFGEKIAKAADLIFAEQSFFDEHPLPTPVAYEIATLDGVEFSSENPEDYEVTEIYTSDDGSQTVAKRPLGKWLQDLNSLHQSGAGFSEEELDRLKEALVQHEYTVAAAEELI